VVVGDWHENDWFIYEGLQPGEQVVVDGALKVRPGSLINAKLLEQKDEAAGSDAVGDRTAKSVAK
jgi:membrane fusion protein (multidrug efflux system)